MMRRLIKSKSVTILVLLMMILSMVLTGCGTKTAADKPQGAPNQPQDQTITDHAGRQVTLPAQIGKVYFTSPIGQVMVYVLAPEKMAGWTMDFSDKTKQYILPEYLDLPYLGGLQMNAKINTEELLKAAPDLIFNVGTDAINDNTINTSDKLQEQLNIPVVVVDARLENTEQALTFMGQLLGAEDKAKEIAAYCNSAMRETVKVTEAIPEDQRARVYYAEGPEGLATEPSGSSHAQLLDILKIINVAQCPATGAVGGMSSVSLEQVLKWNPEVILSWCADRGGAYDKILTSADWKSVQAVKDGKVYEIPNYPYNWFDRPPSISRFLGLKWLTATLYPDQYPIDMVKETKNFYQLFYHIDITDDDAKSLLGNSLH